MNSPIGDAVEVLGLCIASASLSEVVTELCRWLRADERGYVSVTPAYSVMLAREDTEFRKALRGSRIITADGVPVAWAVGMLGGGRGARVSGPELLAELCHATAGTGASHYFYGGAPGVAERLAATLVSSFPGLVVAGAMCPPFGIVSPEDESAHVEEINRSGAKILWVGLGAPKQELWTARNWARLRPNIAIGVGAAFDFFTGGQKKAPRHVQNLGLEWLYRIAFDRNRRRLIQRARTYPAFVVLVARDVLRRRVMGK